ncbi:hypothetical protein M9980_06290 [Sphingomonas donggukensis]|uniref:Tetratricopeptide repeat protein n=1 Tax=Sphingomonas donggukensis TaxID=2949093 RepID=A0ABY4TWL0_9SPHN|nr:hypothetical protein [Sphingomonas donggukensis]URW76800.1 hypothetical protein M9980_06290 [Sphingomonas donggukensis]
MRLISKLALAATLTAGLATTAVVTPAAAQKKDKKGGDSAGAGGPQLKLSPEFRAPLAAAQTALTAKDTATATAKLAEAAPFAKTEDELYAYNALKLQLIAPANDANAMIPVLDVLVKNSKTPATMLPTYNYYRGALPFQQKKYAEALPYLTKARDLGFTNENLNLQIALASMETGDLQGGIAGIQKAIDAEAAAGRKAPESWYSVAIGQLYTKRDPQMITWLNKRVVAYPTAKNWREALVTYRDGKQVKGAPAMDRGTQLDLYRLMRATKSLAGRGDYIEYADTAFYAGLPGETKSVIDEGRATGKVPAGDTAAARLLSDANAGIKNEGSLTGLETKAKAAATGKVALQTGDANLALGNYAKAVELYNVALQKGGIDASEANMRIGIAQTQLGQKDAARTAFRAVTDGTRKEIASFWLTWLDTGTVAGAAPAA